MYDEIKSLLAQAYPGKPRHIKDPELRVKCQRSIHTLTYFLY